VTATTPNEAAASAAVKIRDRIIKPPFFRLFGETQTRYGSTPSANKNCKINAGTAQTQPKNLFMPFAEHLILIIELFSKHLFRVQ